MKILIYGAGVLGSVLAVRLKEANQDVSILARGERYQFIQEKGIVIINFWTKEKTETKVNVVNELHEKDIYDLIIVIMPRTATPEVLQKINKNHTSSDVLFIGNNVSGYDEYSQAIDEKRILLGFWLASGYREGQIVHYSDTNEKGEKGTLVVGEKDGQTTKRVQKIKSAVEKAGIPVEVSENIDAWLKTHAMLIAPLAMGYYKHDCNMQQIIQSKDALKFISKSIKEGISALKKLNIPILPKKLRIIPFLPIFILVNKYKSMLNSKFIKIAFSHAKVAKDEMEYIINECRKIISKANIKSYGYDALSNKD
jgi:2-dehydropantoate 2-reductase